MSALPILMLMDSIQRKAVYVGRQVFGLPAMSDPKERLLRFSEEAAELQQACGLTLEEYIMIGQHVFERAKGEIFQEIGGAGSTLFSLAEVHGLDTLKMVDKECDRVWQNQDAIRAKAAKKPGHIFSTRPISE